MKSIKYIIVAVWMVCICVSCTKGGDLVSADEDTYTISSTLSGEQLSPAVQTSATAKVFGTYDGGDLNILTLDVSWEGLLESGDELVAFDFYNSDAKKVRSITYHSTAVNGIFTVSIAGYRGLLLDEQRDLIGGNWKLVLSTQKHPDGIVGGKLTIGK